MATVTISRTITGDTASGVSLLTIENADTGAEVTLSPALPQPFTDGGGGVWSFTFTDVGASSYHYTYRITWADDGATEDQEGDVRGAGGDHYGSRTGIEAHGLYNADVFADIESTSDAGEIAARFETALTRADGIVDFEAGKLQVDVPADTDTVYYPQIVDGANTYALGYLMMGRGEPVAPGKLAGWQVMMEAGIKQIVDALTAYGDSVDESPLANTFEFVPIVRITSTTDENSRPLGF